MEETIQSFSYPEYTRYDVTGKNEYGYHGQHRVRKETRMSKLPQYLKIEVRRVHFNEHTKLGEKVNTPFYYQQ